MRLISKPPPQHVYCSSTIPNEAFDRGIRGWLEDGYCSITGHGLIRLIRFGSQSCTYLWKGFANKLHLICHAYKIPSWIFFRKEPNMATHVFIINTDSSLSNILNTQTLLFLIHAIAISSPLINLLHNWARKSLYTYSVNTIFWSWAKDYVLCTSPYQHFEHMAKCTGLPDHRHILFSFFFATYYYFVTSL